MFVYQRVYIFRLFRTGFLGLPFNTWVCRFFYSGCLKHLCNEKPIQCRHIFFTFSGDIRKMVVILNKHSLLQCCVLNNRRPNIATATGTEASLWQNKDLSSHPAIGESVSTESVRKLKFGSSPDLFVHEKNPSWSQQKTVLHNKAIQSILYTLSKTQHSILWVCDNKRIFVKKQDIIY